MVHINNLEKSYNNIKVLDGISLDIKKGEFVFLIGKSGAGKTTLMDLLLCDLKADSGSINVNGIQLEKLVSRYMYRYRRYIGVVFQDFRLIPEWTVYENVAFAQIVVGQPSRKIKKRVMEVLEIVGMADKAQNYPGRLSGGEMQRAAIARAVVNKPLLLLADEPTRNLDRWNAINVVKLLEKINASGTTVLMATHNREVVNALGKRVITLEEGKIINDSNPGRYYFGI